MADLEGAGLPAALLYMVQSPPFQLILLSTTRIGNHENAASSESVEVDVPSCQITRRDQSATFRHESMTSNETVWQ